MCMATIFFKKKQRWKICYINEKELKINFKIFRIWILVTADKRQKKNPSLCIYTQIKSACIPSLPVYPLYILQSCSCSMRKSSLLIKSIICTYIVPVCIAVLLRFAWSWIIKGYPSSKVRSFPMCCYISCAFYFSSPYKLSCAS